MTEQDVRLVLPNLSDSHEYAEFAALRNGGILIAVTEEKAMDSYNQEFECKLYASAEQATALRDWLLAHFPIDATNEHSPTG